ncbi:DsbA family protein [Parvularcula flava]|uniref:DsbA family protein n=1 Tax=Aquisalinus luteolus TaxID=1566827 RepID=A0A8J3A320_9PROT|nr:thioredoxin domain-containing protein [Aquisalinus luteolus]NHK28727.1 DsbA family protein [Aquisalinus luteolus]GGH99338.1 hypothetical protein GCM10011355_25060 [Aquisalinus luteolus]
MNATRFFVAVSAALVMVACDQSEADNEPVDPVAEDGQSAAAGNGSDAEIIVEDDTPPVPGTEAMVLGEAEAPITLIEYASVTCPHCAAYHEYVFPILQEHYIEPGLVRFEFRDFPTAPPQLSYLGASIARCAAAQKGSDAYFSMVDTLFEHQVDWVSPEYEAHLSSYVVEADLTEPELLECINSDAVFDAINENVRMGMEKHQIGGTPSFVISDSKLEGYNSATYEGYFELIDAALTDAGATPPADLPALPEITMAHAHDHNH